MTEIPTVRDIQEPLMEKFRVSANEQLRSMGWASMTTNGLTLENISVLINEAKEAGYIVSKSDRDYSVGDLYFSTKLLSFMGKEI